MRQTTPYTASQYNSDNGFPLTWICRCCCGTARYESGIEEEATEYHLRNMTKPGVIVGRPARKYEMNYERQEEPHRAEGS